MRQIYLNNAGSAFPLAPGVEEAVTACMRAPPLLSGRDVSGSADSLYRCRHSLAGLLAVSPEQVVLLPGATHGLNVAILGLDLRKDDLVITSVTEHNSVLRPLARLEDRLGIRIAYVPLAADMKLDASIYDDLLKEKPRLVVLNHASNVTGRINPVGPWFKKAKSAGAVTLLDASQTVGRIPVHPHELQADLTVFSGHKGLRGPLGTGGLHVAPSVSLAPVLVGGTGVKSDLRGHPDEMPLRLEAGTPNIPAFAGLDRAIRYIMKNVSDITAAEAVMTQKLYRGLAEIEHVHIFDGDLSLQSDAERQTAWDRATWNQTAWNRTAWNRAEAAPNETERLPTISFQVMGMDTDQAGFALRESFGIHCRTGLHCAPLIHTCLGSLPDGTLRFSPSFASPSEDIDHAIDAVRRLAE
ncbi:MAG: aminotransferase class V-fold PLP-dependent enzyme [Peptococcaceae bacterium]|nr:aminotransferase class V-fold PLP-dependent enzyme [Peptococcaceae bacterium]